jgi:hypothetical protein
MSLDYLKPNVMSRDNYLLLLTTGRDPKIEL